ncbi:hydroxyacylglutathione hydrolase, mitochondrial-like [Stegodyphus dumicola]|uniref:hydroxyacylglutathione hydrolase, mitochondrial-like n=1 Tax=Stegodyphus dumicola TaxID=202533 RepID=UPI0015AD1BA8|nr:hydroxyacylglutathione hydrolase, mitochondrial-like [Stegodyphus dumicola]
MNFAYAFRRFSTNISPKKLFVRYYNISATSPVNERCEVRVLNALKDNYMYILMDKDLKIAAAVDPVEPAKILNTIKEENVELKAVLTTHHHFDHAGGNKVIHDVLPDIPIYGGDDRIDSLTKKLSHNEEFKIGPILIKCLLTPCHTSGHVCYFIDLDNEPICFTGDTLFIAGCGRFFEGSASQMLHSLQLLAALPKCTRVYCGHEYTLSNLKFSLAVEPDNTATVNKMKTVEEKLAKYEPSVPSTIGEELSYNPFLRVDQEQLHIYTKKTDPVDVMRVLRDLKDNFKS